MEGLGDNVERRPNNLGCLEEQHQIGPPAKAFFILEVWTPEPIEARVKTRPMFFCAHLCQL